MTLPSVEATRNWSGLTAVDSDDQPLGRITDIYLDHDTGQPEWALVATPQRRRTFVPLAGAARKGDRIAVAVPRAAVGDAPAVRPGRELSDNDAARLYGHYVGSSVDGNRGARRARARGPVARLRAATAPPGRSAAARLRESRDRVPEARRSGRLQWLLLAGLGSALGMVAVLAGRVRRRRAPTVGEALGRALAELLAAFQAALPRGRGRRWLGSLGGPRRGGSRR
jgi:PRC-barrel domain